MIANFCRDNAVAGMRGCGDGHGSSQSTEMREVTAAQHWETSNSFACNELGECKRFADGEKAGARHKKPVRPSTLVRWLRFNFVGGIGIAVQFVALFVMKTVFHFNYLAATALAVEAAVVHNFIWHKRFTWADRVQPSGRSSITRLVRFNVTVGAVSIVGNLALMEVMVGLGHMNYLVANAIAIGLCSLANFLVSEEWVFEEC